MDAKQYMAESGEWSQGGFGYREILDVADCLFAIKRVVGVRFIVGEEAFRGLSTFLRFTLAGAGTEAGPLSFMVLVVLLFRFVLRLGGRSIMELFIVLDISRLVHFRELRSCSKRIQETRRAVGARHPPQAAFLFRNKNQNTDK